MKKNSYSQMAYTKTEELEQRIVSLAKKIYEVEAMLPTPIEPDPNDTPDEPYTPPAPGTIITTSVLTNVPYYYTHNSTFTAYPIFFSSDPNSTLIIKLDVNMEILNSPCDMTFRIYLDDVKLDEYLLTSPNNGTYKIPFAVNSTATTAGHKLHFVVLTDNTNISYKITNADVEILGNNVDIVKNTNTKNVYYNNNGTYYITKCKEGEGTALESQASAVNLNLPFENVMSGVVELDHMQAYEYIDGFWQLHTLGIAYRLATGAYYIQNASDANKVSSLSTCHKVDFMIPETNFSGFYALQANSLGNLSYFKVVPDCSTRTTKAIEVSENYYVDVAAVKILDNEVNPNTRKPRFVATKIDGTNYFFSDLYNYYTVNLGYGTNPTAYYANTEGTKILVYLRVYNALVEKEITYNETTNQYELTRETAIGTWNKYIKGTQNQYFSITDSTLTYNEQV